jgi:DNA-binding CsgD family transcriptional regulator
MTGLSGSDARGVLAVLHEAAAVEERVAFSEPVLEKLRRLIPCDVVAFHERSVGYPADSYVGEPLGAFTRAMRDAEQRFLHQDAPAPGAGARTISDVLSRRAFRRLELYQEVCRPLGIEYMMRLWLEPDGAGGARLEFDRHKRDFSARDRSVLDALLPYLRQLCRHALLRRRVSKTPLGAVAERLSRREREILELVAVGKTNAEVASLLWISPETVRKHLENAYAKLDVHTRTGAVAALYGRGS